MYIETFTYEWQIRTRLLKGTQLQLHDGKKNTAKHSIRSNNLYEVCELSLRTTRKNDVIVSKMEMMSYRHKIKMFIYVNMSKINRNRLWSKWGNSRRAITKNYSLNAFFIYFFSYYSYTDCLLDTKTRPSRPPKIKTALFSKTLICYV